MKTILLHLSLQLIPLSVLSYMLTLISQLTLSGAVNHVISRFLQLVTSILQYSNTRSQPISLLMIFSLYLQYAAVLHSLSTSPLSVCRFIISSATTNSVWTPWGWGGIYLAVSKGQCPLIRKVSLQSRHFCQDLITRYHVVINKCLLHSLVSLSEIEYAQLCLSV